MDSIIKEDEQPKTFEQSGIFITEDDITVDIANTTGLRKTGYSANLYGDDGVPLKPLTDSKIPRSPAPVRRRRSIDNVSTESTKDTSLSRKTPVYRSVRKPTANVATTGTKKEIPTKDVNTWSGRTAKKRPTIGTDTFSSNGVTTNGNNSSPSFNRNSSIRGSQTLYDKNGRRLPKSTTASANTSPTKPTVATSPLAQQLLEAAGSAKNDTQILEKMKTLLSKYTKNKTDEGNTKDYDDFTTAWVNSNGTLDRVTNCSTSPVKMQSKRSSAASSIDSVHSKDITAVLSPRRDRGLSRIPAPIRQNTELY